MGGVTGTSFVPPVFTNPYNFAHAAVFGVGGARGMVWREAVQEGRIDRARAQRAVEHLVTASRSRVDRFAPLNPRAVQAILLPSVAEQRVSATAGGGASHGTRYKPQQLVSAGTTEPTVVSDPLLTQQLDAEGCKLFLALDGKGFNDLRKKNPKWIPDLSGVSLDTRGDGRTQGLLSRADLRGINLSGANLHGATLIAVDLRGADLRKANLVWIDAWMTDLRGARLEGVRINVIWDGGNLYDPLNGAILDEAGLSELRQSIEHLGQVDPFLGEI